MRKLATISLILLCSSSATAQTRTTGSTGSTGSNFGSGSIFSSTGPSTGTLNSSSSGTSSSSTGSSSSTLSSNFSQGFTSTGITNPFGASTTGRTGTMGMTGMGGMGGMGMMGMGGMGGMGMMGMGMGGMGMGMGGMGRNQQNMRGGMGGTGQQQYSMRPTVKLGFEPNLPATQVRSQAIRTTMARIPAAEKFAGVSVSVEGRKAIVTGSVEQGQVELLKRLLQLEPGIYEVDMSQVNVESSPSRIRAGAEPVIPTETVPNPS